MELVFDKKLLQELIDRANGQGQINQYCDKCGVSTGYMMKFITGESDHPPVPSLLVRMAESSDGRVHFREFFEACGYGNDMIKEYENYVYQKDDENDPDHRVCDVVQLDEARGVIAGIGALYSAGSRELSIIKQLIDTLPMISFRAVPCKRETEND
ncbi:MAG: hypothetical protein PUK75_06705 [bacterium]|nr:hypothetical protein [bacterium]MDY4099827.1 hypothetical protein [Lachnospiraceae bacterium]